MNCWAKWPKPFGASLIFQLLHGQNYILWRTAWSKKWFLRSPCTNRYFFKFVYSIFLCAIDLQKSVGPIGPTQWEIGVSVRISAWYGCKCQKHNLRQKYNQFLLILQKTLLNPLVTSVTFFGKILMKLAGMAHNAKNGIPLFCFIFKMNSNEDIVI
jgi:hypothetical protein